MDAHLSASHNRYPEFFWAFCIFLSKWEFSPFLSAKLSFEMVTFHPVSNSNPRLAVTLQIQDQELPTGVDIGPVGEGQHQLFQQADGSNLIPVVVVVFPKFTSHVLLDGQPLVCWMAVDEENFQEPVGINRAWQQLAR